MGAGTHAGFVRIDRASCAANLAAAYPGDDMSFVRAFGWSINPAQLHFATLVTHTLPGSPHARVFAHGIPFGWHPSAQELLLDRRRFVSMLEAQHSTLAGGPYRSSAYTLLYQYGYHVGWELEDFILPREDYPAQESLVWHTQIRSIVPPLRADHAAETDRLIESLLGEPGEPLFPVTI